jgi:hypothetical protein
MKNTAKNKENKKNDRQNRTLRCICVHKRGIILKWMFLSQTKQHWTSGVDTVNPEKIMHIIRAGGRCLANLRFHMYYVMDKPGIYRSH